MKKILVTLLTSLTIVNSYAQTPTPAPIISANGENNEVVFIQKDTEAPFTGYLFTPNNASKIKAELIQLDYYKQLELSYEKSIDLYKKNEDIYNFKVNTLLEQNDKLADALYKSKDRDTWENRFWFVAGIFVTGSAVYLATKLK